MALKPNGGVCRIKEQIIEDQASGLTLQFALLPESDAPVRLRMFGDALTGNREILFDADGNEVGAGTHLDDTVFRGWLTEVAI